MKSHKVEKGILTITREDGNRVTYTKESLERAEALLQKVKPLNEFEVQKYKNQLEELASLKQKLNSK